MYLFTLIELNFYATENRLEISSIISMHNQVKFNELGIYTESCERQKVTRRAAFVFGKRIVMYEFSKQCIQCI